jgi:hypothetical protein
MVSEYGRSWVERGLCEGYYQNRLLLPCSRAPHSWARRTCRNHHRLILRRSNDRCSRRIGHREADDQPGRLFERFVSNLHHADDSTPSVITGFGRYAGSDVADGYVIVCDGRD